VADALRIEMGGRLVPILLRLAQEQGRAPNEIMQEALVRYLHEQGLETGPDIGKPIETIHAEPPEDAPRNPLPGLLDRMSSRFDLDEDEAMRIAVEEQHAFRAERSERQRRGSGR
jgi:hypothetical protein